MLQIDRIRIHHLSGVRSGIGSGNLRKSQHLSVRRILLHPAKRTICPPARVVSACHCDRIVRAHFIDDITKQITAHFDVGFRFKQDGNIRSPVACIIPYPFKSFWHELHQAPRVFAADRAGIIIALLLDDSGHKSGIQLILRCIAFDEFTVQHLMGGHHSLILDSFLVSLCIQPPQLFRGAAPGRGCRNQCAQENKNNSALYSGSKASFLFSAIPRLFFGR